MGRFLSGRLPRPPGRRRSFLLHGRTSPSSGPAAACRGRQRAGGGVRRGSVNCGLWKTKTLREVTWVSPGTSSGWRRSWDPEPPRPPRCGGTAAGRAPSLALATVARAATVSIRCQWATQIGTEPENEATWTAKTVLLQRWWRQALPLFFKAATLPSRALIHHGHIVSIQNIKVGVRGQIYILLLVQCHQLY